MGIGVTGELDTFEALDGFFLRCRAKQFADPLLKLGVVDFDPKFVFHKVEFASARGTAGVRHAILELLEDAGRERGLDCQKEKRARRIPIFFAKRLHDWPINFGNKSVTVCFWLRETLLLGGFDNERNVRTRKTAHHVGVRCSSWALKSFDIPRAKGLASTDQWRMNDMTSLRGLVPRLSTGSKLLPHELGVLRSKQMIEIRVALA